MESNSPRYGLLVSALGAILLAVAVFLPWYGLSLTAGGVSFAQQLSSQVASEFGNAQLQSYVAQAHASLGSLAGHQLVAVSAHQALKQINVLLLILASVAILLALFALARGETSVTGSEGTLISGLGLIAMMCVLFRMVDPPNPASSLFSLSLREGAWLALGGSVAMVLGGLWPARVARAGSVSPAKLQSALSELSGWTPQD
jgi:hypothetical protein